MSEQEIVTLRRDCQGFLIPAGTSLHLPKGTEVTIVQSLGGNYTVNVYGNWVQINAIDADALGKAVEHSMVFDDNASLEDKAWSLMKTCFDPEIPVNIVDLGLVYKCDLTKNDEDNYQANVDMTLTAPGCGMGPVLAADVKSKLETLAEIDKAHVEIVLDPPWNQNMISDEGKLQLGLL
jgi:probable FeS assembly SUF system protein SufT